MGDAIIEFDKVVAGYSPSLTILNETTLDARKGEITLLIGKALEPEPDDTPVPDAVEALVRDGIPRMDAIKQVARRRGLSKREVYAQLVRD